MIICPEGMTPAGYERDIRHLALSLEGADFPFDLGVSWKWRIKTFGQAALSLQKPCS